MQKANHIQSMITSLRNREIFVKNNSLILNKDLTFSVSHGKKNYITKLENGEIVLPSDIMNPFWVVITIDKDTAKKSTNFFDRDPTIYGKDFPTNATNGDLFYNTTNRKSFYYMSGKWIEQIRINVCKIESKEVAEIYSTSSQVGLDNIPHVAEEIYFFKNSKPKKIITQNSFFFVTDNDLLLLDLKEIDQKSFEGTSAKHISRMNIKKGDLVTKDENGGIIRATNISTNCPVIGIAMVDSSDGEECIIKEMGFLGNKEWRWANPPNTKLYCGSDGNLTLSPNWNANSVQEVGYIVDTYTIYFDPQSQIIINN